MKHLSTPAPIIGDSDTIYFVCVHPFSAIHFSAFVKPLDRKKIKYRILAAGAVLETFRREYIAVENIEEIFQTRIPLGFSESKKEAQILAKKVAKMLCSSARVVFTDVGTHFMHAVHKELNKIGPNILHVAHYENPEQFVPGEYSENAAKIIEMANAVTFSNVHLAVDGIYLHDNQISLKDKIVHGFGFYPKEEALTLRRARASGNRDSTKSSFLHENNIPPQSFLLVYIGGANKIYYEDAFPSFIEILSEAINQEDLSWVTLVFQQHPRAKTEGKDIDGQLLRNFVKHPNAPNIVFSNLKSAHEALIIADAVAYFQTGISPMFAIAEIPCFQVTGKFCYQDMLVKKELCLTINQLQVEDFVDALQSIRMYSAPPKTEQEENDHLESILSKIGWDKNWEERVVSFCSNPSGLP